jgi:transposase-like protein
LRHKKEKISYNGNMKKRNQYTAEFKTKVVIEVLREEGPLNEIAAQYGVSPVMISRWKVEFLEHAPDVFKRGPSAAEKDLQAEKERTAQLERKVGQITYEFEWLKKKSYEIFKRKRP